MSVAEVPSSTGLTMGVAVPPVAIVETAALPSFLRAWRARDDPTTIATRG